MKKNYSLILIAFLCFVVSGYGQIITFDFNGLTGSEASATSNFNNPNINNSTITRGAGLVATNNASRFNANDWASTDITTAVAGNDYMEFTITPNATYQFNVTTIDVNFERSGTGPRGILLRSSLDGYATDIDTEKSIADNTSTQAFTFTVGQTGNTAAVTYRIYGWAEATGGTGGFEGTGNDIVVNGSVNSTCTDAVDFERLLSPTISPDTILQGNPFVVSTIAVEPGVTDMAGEAAGIEAWIGYSSTDNDPSTSSGWTWVAATYTGDVGGNDIHTADIGTGLAPGTYYYASRHSLNGCAYTYGGTVTAITFWNNDSQELIVTSAPCGDLIISEYVEGSGNNKYLEIFNGTGSTVNLANYDIEIYNNGSATPTNTFSLSGTLLDGQTLVLQDNSATLYTGTVTTLPFGVSFNGDDAIALVNNSTIIDVIGQIGFDPGTAWTGGSSSTLNRTLRRKSTIQTGDADGSNVYDPNVEWDTFPIDSVDDLGFHFSSCFSDREMQLQINSSNIDCGFTYNYGNQIINSTTDVVLTIQNIGTLDLEITGLSFASGAEYSLVGAPTTPFTIAGSGSQDITIRFNPVNTIGVFTDTLTVESDDISESICDINLYGISSSNCGTTTTIFAAQDFESLASDTWSYTAAHAPIAGNWDFTTNLTDISGPQSGTNFWGITDLERSGHTNQTHELSFSQSLAGFSNVQLSFYYYTINLDAGDSLEYEIFYDTISQGTNDISANNDAWTQVLVNIPDSVGTVDIIFYADMDAVNDQAGIDNLTLSSTIINTATWDGTTWNWNNGTAAGTPPTLTDNVILNSPFNTSAGGLQQSFSACSVTVNDVTLTIDDGDYVEVQNDLIVNGVNGTVSIEPEGSFVQINDIGAVSATIPTNLAVSKLTAPADDWFEYTFWSSPVFEETPAIAFASSNPIRRFQYNALNFRDSEYETANQNPLPGAGIDDIDDTAPFDWGDITATYLEPGMGYASTHNPGLFPFTGANGSCSLTFPQVCRVRYTFSGLFNNGVITPTVYRNDAETGDNNWNLIGNPYPSAIAVNGPNGFLTQNGTFVTDGAVNGAIYIWSQSRAPSTTENGNQNSNFSQSDFAIINGLGTVSAGGDTNGDGTIDAADRPDEYIPSGQAFFISMSDTVTPVSTFNHPVTGDPIAAAYITFNNAMRVTSNNNLFFRDNNTNQDNKLWLNLESDNGVSNEILIGYVENASNGNDGMYYDAPRNGSTDVNSIIYSTIPNVDKRFAIQGKNLNSLTTEEIIPIGFYNAIEEATIYTLSIAQLEGDFMNGNAIYVIDNLYNNIHELSASDYTFTSETGEFNDRFEIVFRADALSIDDNIISSNELTIIELSNGDIKITVNSSDLNIINVEILDVLGRLIYNLSGNSSTEIYNLSQLSKAAYIAKVTLSNGQVISKKAIKQH